MTSWLPGFQKICRRAHVSYLRTVVLHLISDKIGIEYLQHLIKHTDCGPDADWKLLLMDNHGSHITPEFVKLANENRIRPFPFIPHLC